MAALPQLEAAHLSDLKRLADIDPLAKCKTLAELHLCCGLWNALSLDSLEPLRGLTQLDYLSLSPQTKEPTLEPLRGLKNLKELSLNGRFPFEEYARLAGKLPKDIKCEHFSDMFSDFKDIKACRKCKQKDLVIGVWKKGPTLCVHCDAEKIQHWRDEFARLRDDAAKRSAW